MKKFLFLILTFILFNFNVQSASSQEFPYRTNDMRKLFLNNEAIIYAINIRTFSAKDKDGNEIIEKNKGEIAGNFINAIERLPELENLGINTIHLLPITPVGKYKAIGTAGSLYAMSSLTSLNPQLKDEKNSLNINDQAKLFISECHRHGIRVIIDLPSCGSYDYYMSEPSLFVLDKKNQPVIPADWTDVRLFKTQNDDGSLNEELFLLHKKFIDMIQSLGADGIRADVATIKPYEFWVKLISYAREKDPQFLFLAEASDSWMVSPSNYAVFTNYKKLLQAGFDGYYGSYFNFKNWTSVNELKKQVDLNIKLSNTFKDKKAVIGSFATHDELSPIVVNGEKLSSMLTWLNATLPLNPYYIDGFITGDNYLYSYANKKADMTYTDDDYYYVHKGKIDIFNFSRMPQGHSSEIFNDYYLSIKLRQYVSDLIIKGSFRVLKTKNKKIFAYQRSYNQKNLVIILNTDFKYNQDARVSISSCKKDAYVLPIKAISPPNITNNFIRINMIPGEVAVILFE